MRILQSIALEGRSAGSEWAIAYSRALRAMGHRIFFLTIPFSQTFEKAQRAGLEMIEGIDLSEKNLTFLKGLPRLKDVLSSVQPDTVITHWGPDHLCWGWTLRKEKIPLVRVRSHSSLSPKRHFLSRWLQKKTALYIAGNRQQLHQYVDRLKLPEEKVLQLPFGLDLSDYQLNGTAFRVPSNRAVRLLQLGRFSPVKGHRFLLQSLGKLKSQLAPFRLTIAGFEAEFKAADLQAWREESGLWDQAEIFSNLPDVRNLMAACDIGIIASTGSEAVARVALEFMAMGKPLIVCRVGILPELVDESTGWLFEAGDFQSFSVATKNALISREQYPEMGRKTRKKVENEYDLNKLAVQLEAALEKLVTNA